jgi:hypothetical protein
MAVGCSPHRGEASRKHSCSRGPDWRPRAAAGFGVDATLPWSTDVARQGICLCVLEPIRQYSHFPRIASGLASSALLTMEPDRDSHDDNYLGDGWMDRYQLSRTQAMNAMTFTFNTAPCVASAGVMCLPMGRLGFCLYLMQNHILTLALQTASPFVASIEGPRQ